MLAVVSILANIDPSFTRSFVAVSSVCVFFFFHIANACVLLALKKKSAGLARKFNAAVKGQSEDISTKVRGTVLVCQS